MVSEARSQAIPLPARQLSKCYRENSVIIGLYTYVNCCPADKTRDASCRLSSGVPRVDIQCQEPKYAVPSLITFDNAVRKAVTFSGVDFDTHL